MNKKIQIFVLTTLVASQFSGIITNISYYASEVKSEAETINIESEIQESEVVSEEVSEITEEITPTSEVSEVASEEIVEPVDTTDTTDQITAEIVIDEDGAVTKQARSSRSAVSATPTLKEGENETTYVNQERIASGSGESTINIKASSQNSRQVSNKEVYYVLDSEGNIVSGSLRQPRSYSGNMITVLNGTIVEADSAVARTSGGYETSFYIYNTLEDLKNNTDGVPISGGGFDATYIDTIEEDGRYYYQIKISGYEGYVAAENIQIVPEELIQSRSYYVSENGDWVYYSSMDAVNSTEYDRMELGEAPAEVEPGVKYFSDDDETFSTRSIITPQTTAGVVYNSYYMNLPFRSESSYSAADYKKYLGAKGYSNSTYYNATSSFTDAQSLENVNSLLLFSMANHESAFGTSSYAKACYNFFGRGAIDSDPDKACQQYGYNTARDGILAQALFLQNDYFDALDWRYSGIHAGNKASGMNVKYASDVDWGKKISNHAYMTDQYLGGKDANKYAILEVKGNSDVYTSSSLSKKVKSNGVSGTFNNYNISPQTSINKSVYVVGLLQENNAYQIYTPSGVKKTTSSDCSYTNSMKGTYPNYGGRKKLTLDINTSNYACDYESFGNQKYWISKTGATVINGKTIPSAATSKKIYEYYSDGKKRFEFNVNSNTNVINYAYEYDKSGNIIKKYTYFSGTVYGQNHSKKVQMVYYVKNNIVTSARKYNSSQQLINIYEYYSGATLSNAGSKVKYRFDMKAGTNYINKSYRYTTGQQIDRLYEYQPNTTYGTHSKHFKTLYNVKDSSLAINFAIGYNTSNQQVSKTTYTSGTIYNKNHDQRKAMVYNLNNGYVTSGRKYNSSQQLTNIYEYYSGSTQSDADKRIKYRFDMQTGTNYINKSYRYTTGQQIDRLYEYQPNTKYGGHSKYFKTLYNIKDNSMAINFAIGYNTKNQQVTKTTYTSGTTYGKDMDQRKVMVYNLSGKYVTSGRKYNSAQQLTNIYEYHSGSTQSDADKRVKYRFDMQVGTDYINKSYRYTLGQQIDRLYEYQPNTKYGGHSKYFKTLYNIKDNSLAINFAIGYNTKNQQVTKTTYTSGTTYGKDMDQRKVMVYNLNGKYVTSGRKYNSAQQLTDIYEYHSGSTQSNADKRVKYRFDMKTGTNYINKSYRYTIGQQIDRIYEYQPNTTYGTHSKYFKTLYNIKDNSLEINFAVGYDTNNVQVVRYTYKKGTIYGKNHNSQIVKEEKI